MVFAGMWQLQCSPRYRLQVRRLRYVNCGLGYASFGFEITTLSNVVILTQSKLECSCQHWWPDARALRDLEGSHNE